MWPLQGENNNNNKSITDRYVHTWRFINRLGKEGKLHRFGYLANAYIVRVCVNMTRFSTRFSSCGGKEWGNWGEGHDEEVRAWACLVVILIVGGPHKRYFAGNLLLTLVEFVTLPWRQFGWPLYTPPRWWGWHTQGGEGSFVDTKIKSGDGDDDDDGVLLLLRLFFDPLHMDGNGAMYVTTAILVACVKHASPPYISL